MTNGRKAPLDRILSLVRRLSDSVEGLTIEEMAECLGQGRRSAERARRVIALHFDLEQRADGARKRWRIDEGLRRSFVRASAAELAALQAEVERQEAEGAAHAPLLRTLLEKVRASFDIREKRRLDPDLEVLEAHQRGHVGPGPRVNVDPAISVTIMDAMLRGQCIEFDYLRPGSDRPDWRRVCCLGLVHGAVSYLCGQFPKGGQDPVLYRLDRMQQVRLSDTAGNPPKGFDLDEWLSTSFGLWRGDAHEVRLRIPAGPPADRGRAWRFHPKQEITELADGSLEVRFRASGLRELAEHLFTWAGEIEVLGPNELVKELQERLALAATMLTRAKVEA
nr:WYL domain-containing protein [uncultured Sphingomonas sp.]